MVKKSPRRFRRAISVHGEQLRFFDREKIVLGHYYPENGSKSSGVTTGGGLE
jgi:hypothetical protein